MKMVPNAEGTTTNLTDRVPFTINETVDLAGTHIEEFTDLIVGIFIQNNSTREVFQSTYSNENAVYSEEARLSELTLNGSPLPAFNPDVFDYDVVLPSGTSIVPVLEGNAVNEEATVIIVPSVTLPGTTTIDVFAGNLIAHNTYTVNFQFPVGYDETTAEAVRMYPNPTHGNLNLFGASHAKVSLFNSLGIEVKTIDDFVANTIDLSTLPKGIYVVKIEKTGQTVIQKKIIVL